MLRSEPTDGRRFDGRPPAAVLALCLGLMLALGPGAPAALGETPGPAVSNAHLDEGRAALDARAHERAVLEFERAITADPRNARAFAWLGHAHGEAGRPELARKYFRIALSIDPGDVKALLWDGQMDIANQDLDGARENLQRMARVCTRDCKEYQTLEHSIRRLTARLERR